MKNGLLNIAFFVAISVILFAASSRIKDFATTTTTAANDDYVVLDGITNGTCKMLASYMFGSGNVINNTTLASGNATIGGGTTVVGTSNVTWNATNNMLTLSNIVVFTNTTIGDGAGGVRGQLIAETFLFRVNSVTGTIAWPN